MEPRKVVLSRLLRAVAVPHLSNEFTAGHDERRHRLAVAFKGPLPHREGQLQVALTCGRHPERDASFRVTHRRAFGSIKVRTGSEDFLSEGAREFVLTDQ